ncbi:hypothetical protein CFC21_068191 [Triticum aestivum]|uniref:TF-B3 domain-containing protein n=2 Tax=Triticum aestivum TaxID=4565 RepID=A0A9R1HBB9_WHEAT|nr:putative B3 domain-containing protein Os08g0325100 [Triticum aestivum]KAF7061501.1 hypothetical protein CFC21_068191 [Triticum aestivum]
MCTSLERLNLWDEYRYKLLDDEEKHFLVLMLGDFRDAMIFPEELVWRFKCEIPGEIKLVSRKGYSHAIVVAKNQEKLVFTVGWRQFVGQYDLQMGDSLILKYNGNCQFDVIIFDKLGREKALSVVVDPFLPQVQENPNKAHEIGSSKKIDVPSERYKSWTEYHYTNLDDEKKYFLMVMMGDFQHEMIIPEEFVRRFKGEFRREMILEAKNRCSYIIAVAKNQEKLVLTVGWGIFVKTFGLEMGDTIVLRYNGNSQFSVIIFDKLGCEKALSVVDLFPPLVQERHTTVKSSHLHPQPIQMVLPESPPTKRQRHFQMEVDESCQGKITAINISSAEPSGESFSSEDNHGTRDVPGSNYILRKKKANLSSFLFEGDSFSSEDGHGGRDAIVKKEAKLTSAQKEQLNDGYITVRKTKLTSAQKEVVKQKVQSIHSEIPIFVAVMSKTNVDSGFFLTFSRYYANKYLGEEPHMDLQLLGKKWGVRFLDHRCDRKLGSGWRQFVEENNLKMGDICLFELLSNQKRTMEVYIIPANGYNYSAGVQNDVDQEALEGGSAALQREALAHHADGARDPDSILLRITN